MTPGNHVLQDTIVANFTYLALGDSYTIGESVSEDQRFPVQTAKLLAEAGIQMAPPHIIAKTGWTTDELETAINDAAINNTFSVVTLLIGVNNQYRGLSIPEYKTGFTRLIQRAIRFAGDHSDRVIVLSIPDWGVVPFAEGRDRAQIGSEINAFNAANKTIARKFRVHYLDITTDSRAAADDASLVAGDGLHYSGKAMAIWAGKLAGIMQAILQ